MDEPIHSDRDAVQTCEPANAPGAKPRFATTDPSNEQPGPSYDGHTLDETLGIAREVRLAWEAWRRTRSPSGLS